MPRLSPRRSVAFRFALLACFVLCPPASADVIEVPGDFATLQSAINSANDFDTIELAAGTYPAPSTAGFQMVNLGKSLTIRAADGAAVTLDGQGTSRIVRYENSTVGDDSVTFEGIRFFRGFSATEGLAGGVTVNGANATFVDCVFEDAEGSPATTAGGALLAFGGSTVHVIDSMFLDNQAKNSGGAIAIGANTTLFVHGSEFIGNRTNAPNHRQGASGGAIANVDGDLLIGNSRFEGNEAGCVGGAVFTLGTFTGSTAPTAETWITNSTFVSNAATPDMAALCSFSPEGGAVHTENQAITRISASRFELNSATVGGGVSTYRGTVEVDQSVFRGNFTVLGGASSFGGAILVGSNDTGADGANNRPSGKLTVDRSFFQGRFGAVTNASVRGACIFGLGDTNRTFGQGGASQNGTGATNRAEVTISDSIFADCDVVSDSGVSSSGGALGGSHLDLSITGSTFIDSDATGSLFPAGGALFVITDSVVSIEDSVFANNTAGDRGGAIAVSGSDLDVLGSLFFENSAGGAGTVFHTEPQTFAAVPLPVTGEITGNVFSVNGGILFRETDSATGPINDLRYNQNDFFEGSTVFFNTLAGGLSVAQLNTVTVTRNGGVGNTKKSQVANFAMASQPNLASALVAPNEIRQVGAAGDPPLSDSTFLAYAWSSAAGTGTLDGVPLPGTTGTTTVDVGSHTVAVSGATDPDTAFDALTPAVSLTASPGSIAGGQSSDLSWDILDGTLLRSTIDGAISNSEDSQARRRSRPRKR